MSNHNEDLDDLRAVGAGDAEAFRRIYQRYKNRVYGFAYRMLGNQAIAEDVTQEAFLLLIEHPERYEPDRAALLTFLCGVTRNHVLRYFRRLGHDFETAGDELDSHSSEAGSERDPLSKVLEQELSVMIDEAISNLPPRQREVLVLREFGDLSYDEIAKVIGVEVGVIRVRLHRSRKSLAKALAPYLISGGITANELR